MATGDRAEAERTFRRAVQVAPTSVSAYLGLANFLWSTGRAGEAEAALKHALALDPTNLSANRALGLLYLATAPARAEPIIQTIAKVSH